MESRWWTVFIRAAVVKYHRQGGLNSRNLLSHNSGGWKSKIKVPAGLVSPESSLVVFQMTILLLPLHVVIPLCMRDPGVSWSVCPNLIL